MLPTVIDGFGMVPKRSVGKTRRIRDSIYSAPQHIEMWYQAVLMWRVGHKPKLQGAARTKIHGPVGIPPFGLL